MRLIFPRTFFSVWILGYRMDRISLFVKPRMRYFPSEKDNKTGKWFCKFYYTDWQGNNRQKWKRGFATKKEALAYERDFLERQSANPDPHEMRYTHHRSNNPFPQLLPVPCFQPDHRDSYLNHSA